MFKYVINGSLPVRLHPVVLKKLPATTRYSTIICWMIAPIHLSCFLPQRPDTTLWDGIFNILCLHIITSGEPSRPKSESTAFNNTPHVKYQCMVFKFCLSCISSQQQTQCLFAVREIYTYYMYFSRHYSIGLHTFLCVIIDYCCNDYYTFRSSILKKLPVETRCLVRWLWCTQQDEGQG